MAANFNFSLISGGSRAKKLILSVNGNPQDLTPFKAYMEVRPSAVPSVSVAPTIAFGSAALPTAVQLYVASLGFTVYHTITLGADSTVNIIIPSDATENLANLAQVRYYYDLWLYDERVSPVDKSDIISGFFTVNPRVTAL